MADLDIVENQDNNLDIQVQQAKDEGYSTEEIKTFLSDSGTSEVEINQLFKTSAPDFGPIAEPIAQDLSDRLQSQETGQTQAEGEAEDLSDLYRNLYGKYSTTGKELVGLFSESSAVSARQDVVKLNRLIAGKLVSKGVDAFLDPQTGELVMKNEAGLVVPIDSSVFNSIVNSKFEAVGAIGGAKLGILAATAIGQIPPLTGLPEELVTVPIGAAIGSAIGAAGGRKADLVLNAFKLKEDLDEKIAADQVIEAGIADSVLGLTGTSVSFLGKKMMRPLINAYNLVTRGNSAGAQRALLKNMQLSEAEAADLVTQWELFNQTPAPGISPKEKAVGVITSTQPGAETFVKQAASIDQEVAFSITKNIDKRAKGLQKSIQNITKENVGGIVQSDLTAYMNDVRNFYRLTRNQATDVINKTDYRFNLEQFAISPVLENMEKTVADPTMQERLVHFAQKIDLLSSDRSFGSLLDLRQTINNFKFKQKAITHTDKVALSKVLSRIDSEIGSTAKTFLPTGQRWLKQFKKAKLEYSKMKSVESNVLFKALNRPGITEEGVASVFNRYVNSIDDTFIDVMEKLPKKTRGTVEASVLNSALRKYSIGDPSSLQAVHFPMLNEALQKVPFKSQEAINVAKAVNQVSQIFKNDIGLSAISGKITVPEFKSYLTANPLVRAQYEFTSSVFNYARRILPGKKNNAYALIVKTSKLLENPLNVRTVEDLVKDLPVDQVPRALSLVEQLQKETAKQQAKSPKVTLPTKFGFKLTKGKALNFSSGRFGKGIYLQQAIKSPNALEEGFNILKTEVDQTRLATLEDIAKITGLPSVAKDIKSNPQLVQDLQLNGFQGLFIEDRIMLFNKPDKLKVSGRFADGTSLKPTVRNSTEIVNANWKQRKEPTKAELNRVVQSIKSKETEREK